MSSIIPGTVLAGRYRLERQLGEGGMGSVWLAEHLALRSRVAIKLMDPAIASNAEGAERFRREAQAAASLRSTHVVQVLDYGLDDLGPFLVMEVLQGQSLAEVLDKTPRLDSRRTAAIIAQVARAMTRAHAANIVHRDLKPDNIFLIREEDQEIVKVLDFGIAKTRDPRFGGIQTQSGVTMGTPHYMSPEQAEGRRSVDYRTDLWAMAMIACECLVGRRVIEGDGWGPLLVAICVQPLPIPSSLGPVPPGFDAWFARATQRDPERRFASAKELADTLLDLVGGTAVLSAPPHLVSGPGGTALNSSPPVAARDRTAPALPPTHLASRLAVTLQDTPSAPRDRPRSWLWYGVPGLGITLSIATLALWLSDKHHAPEPVLAQEGAPAAQRLAPGPASNDLREAQPVIAPAPHEPSGRPPEKAPLPSIAIEPRRTPPALPAASASPTAKPMPKLRCEADPFTGSIRPAKQPNVRSFACRQNPFTGAYVRD